MKSFASTKILLAVSLCVFLSIQYLTAAPSNNAARLRKEDSKSMLGQNKFTKRGFLNDFYEALKTPPQPFIPTPETRFKSFDPSTYIPERMEVNIDLSDPTIIIDEYFLDETYLYLRAGMTQLKQEFELLGHDLYRKTLCEMLGMKCSPKEFNSKHSTIGKVFNLLTFGQWFKFQEHVKDFVQNRSNNHIDNFVLRVHNEVINKLRRQLIAEAEEVRGVKQRWLNQKVRDVVHKVMVDLDAVVRQIHLDTIRNLYESLPSQFKKNLQPFMPNLSETFTNTYDTNNPIPNVDCKDLLNADFSSTGDTPPVQKTKSLISRIPGHKLLTGNRDKIFSRSKYVIARRIMRSEWAIKDMIEVSLLEMFDRMPQQTGNDANYQNYPSWMVHGNGEVPPEFIPYDFLQQGQIPNANGYVHDQNHPTWMDHGVNPNSEFPTEFIHDHNANGYGNDETWMRYDHNANGYGNDEAWMRYDHNANGYGNDEAWMRYDHNANGYGNDEAWMRHPNGKFPIPNQYLSGYQKPNGGAFVSDSTKPPPTVQEKPERPLFDSPWDASVLQSTKPPPSYESLFSRSNSGATSDTSSSFASNSDVQEVTNSDVPKDHGPRWDDHQSTTKWDELFGYDQKAPPIQHVHSAPPNWDEFFGYDQSIQHSAPQNYDDHRSTTSSTQQHTNLYSEPPSAKNSRVHDWVINPYANPSDDDTSSSHGRSQQVDNNNSHASSLWSDDVQSEDLSHSSIPRSHTTNGNLPPRSHGPPHMYPDISFDQISVTRNQFHQQKKVQLSGSQAKSFVQAPPSVHKVTAYVPTSSNKMGEGKSKTD